MADSSVFKRLKYKNIALAMAAILLTTLAIGRACSDDIPKQDQQDASSRHQAVPAAASDTEESSKFSAEGFENNCSYYNVRNKEALGEGDLLILNSAFRFNGTPGDLDGIYHYLFDSNGEQIAWASTTELQGSRRMLTAYNRMITDFYNKTGLSTIMATDIYNTSTERDKPCFEHESGLAIDLRLCMKDEGTFPEFTGEGDYAWFGSNSYKYGFILRYPEGKEDETGVEAMANHYRYVGAPHAEIMFYNDLCLEEYIEYLKKYTLSSPLSFEGEDGGKYALYYVEKSEDKSTNIPIPCNEQGKEYICDISGDNKNGYIVTVLIDESEQAFDDDGAADDTSIEEAPAEDAQQ